MKKSAKQQISEILERYKNKKVDKCPNCGGNFDWHPDDGGYHIENKPVCSDCYYEALGNEIEKHLIGRGSPRG